MTNVAVSIRLAHRGGAHVDTVHEPHPGSYLHWGVISVSYTNLAIIAVMVIVFVLALLVPFGRSRR